MHSSLFGYEKDYYWRDIAEELFTYAFDFNYTGYGQIHLQRFPHGEWTEDSFYSDMISYASLLILITFYYSCTNIVKSVTVEKETQIKVKFVTIYIYTLHNF